MAMSTAKKDDVENEPKLSKRQRQKQLSKNDKNRWLIQHPKIQNMDVRERVQIKDAGLQVTKAELQQQQQQKSSSSSSSSNRVDGIIDPKMDMINSPEVKFGRLLAGTDQRQRHAAVRKLKLWLKARCDPSNTTGGISELDLLKLWKALWFTLYMADKVPVQDELSKQLVSLMWCVAGTPEEDAFAAEQYILMDDEYDEDGNEYEVDEEEEEEQEEGEENDEEDEENREGQQDDDDDDKEEDPEVLIEEIENTLGNDDDDDDDDDDVPHEEVPHCRGVHLVSLFVRTFFKTIRRDWHKMDKYRIDKFYTLIRYMIREIYSYLQQRSWHFGMIRMFNDVLFEEVLREKPNGLRYHVIDVSLEELSKVAASTNTDTQKKKKDDDDDDDEEGESSSPQFTTDVFIDIMEPFLAMSQTGAKDDTVQQRVMERIFDRFLDEYSVLSENALKQKAKEGQQPTNGESSTKKKKGTKQKDDSEDSSKASSTAGSESKPIFRHVSVSQISQFIFGLGSDTETNDRYRKSLYDMHKKFSRRLKQVGDNLDVIDEADDNHDDVVMEEDADEFKTARAPTKSPEEDTSNANHVFESPKEAFSGDGNEMEDDKSGKKKKNKKKKNKRKSSEHEDNEEAAVVVDTPDRSKAAKKRKTDDATADSADHNDDDVQEEVVLISLSEQSQAKKKEADRVAASNEKKKKKNKQSEHQSTSAKVSESKRVKWDKSNKAISHKASMKALKTTTPPPTKERTPEKGILRTKYGQLGDDGTPQRKKSVVTNKNGRKKASDYWST